MLPLMGHSVAQEEPVISVGTVKLVTEEEATSLSSHA